MTGTDFYSCTQHCQSTEQSTQSKAFDTYEGAVLISIIAMSSSSSPYFTLMSYIVIIAVTYMDRGR